MKRWFLALLSVGRRILWLSRAFWSDRFPPGTMTGKGGAERSVLGPLKSHSCS
jgi:hypothetical protein